MIIIITRWVYSLRNHFDHTAGEDEPDVAEETPVPAKAPATPATTVARQQSVMLEHLD